MIALFHGTTLEVSKPLVKVGRKAVDFGQGFYLTKLKKQAALWAETLAERRMNGVPVLNEYVFDIDQAKELSGTRYKIFDFYSTDVCRQLSDVRTGLQLMSDGYVLEDALFEIQTRGLRT